MVRLLPVVTRAPKIAEGTSGLLKFLHGAEHPLKSLESGAKLQRVAGARLSQAEPLFPCLDRHGSFALRAAARAGRRRRTLRFRRPLAAAIYRHPGFSDCLGKRRALVCGDLLLDLSSDEWLWPSLRAN